MEKYEIKEEKIDLGKLANIIIEHKKELVAIIAGGTIIAAGISFVLPKQYESTTLVQMRGSNTELSGSAAMASLMGMNVGGAGSSSPTSYMELMKSRRVVEPIIDSMEWGDEKKKPEVSGFVKQYLDIKNTKQTNLITVTAKGKTPEEAQMISRGVVENFIQLQTESNKQTQSLLVKFLEERIDEVKKDADESREKFSQYQQTHKIYSPDEQARATVAKMNAFDEALGDMKVQEKTSQAKLVAVNAKLGDIHSSSKNYNINDNEIVKGLRNQIVSAQIELLNLRERYTEEHPDVISVKEKINKLNQSLRNEVNTMVASKYTTINPTQAALVSEQANAEVSVAVAKASEEAIQTRIEEKQKELENFPKDMLEYMNLERETKTKEQIYTSLVSQAENAKIKEAMESMDIQVIDYANLPDLNKPSKPNKRMITLVGFLLGLLMGLLYIIYFYKREEVK